WSDDLHVVDSGSTDRTLAICRQFTSRIHQRAFHPESAQYNWILENVPFRHPWLLVVDADETVPPALREEILGAVAAAPAELDAFYVGFRVYFLGRWIQRSTLYGSTLLLRLFRHRQVRYEQRPINPHPIVRGRFGKLQNDLVHHNHNGLTRLVAKYNRYATMEAEQTLRLLRGDAETGLRARPGGNPSERRRWLKQVFMGLPLRPLLKSFYLYVLMRGFLDGAPGLLWCALMGMQEFLVTAKVGARKRGLPI
ncbi:MAG: glycosyltransferase family 2 protein, partial [Terriglobia bacterium]